MRPRTPNKNNTNTCFTHCVTLSLVTMLSACGPSFASSSDGFGDDAATAFETGDSGSDGFSDGTLSDIPADIEPIFCVDNISGQTTCWVAWASAYAQVMLDCQISSIVTLGLWGDAEDVMLPEWGPVTCYPIVGTDQDVCVFGEHGVLLTQTLDGWVPNESAVVGEMAAVSPPC